MSDLTKSAGDDGARSAWIGVGAPILGLVLTIIMLAVAMLAGFAREQDRGFTDTTRRLVASAVDGRTRALSSVTLDYANWEEAFQSITVAWNAEWVAGNFYSSVADGMILFRADGSVRYVWLNEAFQSSGGQLQPAVVQAALALPTLRRLPRAPTQAETVTSTFARVNGQLVLIAVAPVSHEDNGERLAQNGLSRHDYLALIDVVSAEELAGMGQALALDGMVFTAGEESAPSDQTVRNVLTAADGDFVGALEWRHARPGAAAFRRHVWPAIIGFLSIGALAVLISRILVARQILAIARANAALESSQAKSEFLTRVSNELRTPLDAIIGYAEIIREENEALETQTDAGRIITAARHLGHLLNDIIDQSRIDSGRIKINLEVLPVAGMLVEVQGLMRPVANTAGVKLETVSSALADYVFADHVRLRQCLLNMVGNAVKFSKRGAIVSVRARAETVHGKAHVVFDVVDTGLGIAANDQESIFRPFGQANASISKTFGGSGLGLSISRDLAREMGGDITVASELGEGSTFRLSLPAPTASALKAA